MKSYKKTHFYLIIVSHEAPNYKLEVKVVPAFLFIILGSWLKPNNSLTIHQLCNLRQAITLREIKLGLQKYFVLFINELNSSHNTIWFQVVHNNAAELTIGRVYPNIVTVADLDLLV